MSYKALKNEEDKIVNDLNPYIKVRKNIEEGNFASYLRFAVNNGKDEIVMSGKNFTLVNDLLTFAQNVNVEYFSYDQSPLLFMAEVVKEYDKINKTQYLKNNRHFIMAIEETTGMDLYDQIYGD